MKYYETLYIIHPALDSGRIKEIILSMNKVLEKNGGKLVSIDVWGKKKLAYEIDKQKYGTYVLLQFTSDGSSNSKLNMELEHNPNVLAYLTIKINQSQVKEQTLSLDEQIRGDYPTSSSSSGQTHAKENVNKKLDKNENNEEVVEEKDIKNIEDENETDKKALEEHDELSEEETVESNEDESSNNNEESKEE